MSHSSRFEEVPSPLEMIGDLVYSPTTDIPFGKRVRIGLKECTIYESAIEKGYTIGIHAHQVFLKDNQIPNPIILDDQQFTMIIQHLLPQELSPFDQGVWRSFFIVGWMCVYLGIEPDKMEDDETEDDLQE